MLVVESPSSVIPSSVIMQVYVAKCCKYPWGSGSLNMWECPTKWSNHMSTFWVFCSIFFDMNVFCFWALFSVSKEGSGSLGKHNWQCVLFFTNCGLPPGMRKTKHNNKRHLSGCQAKFTSPRVSMLPPYHPDSSWCVYQMTSKLDVWVCGSPARIWCRPMPNWQLDNHQQNSRIPFHHARVSFQCQMLEAPYKVKPTSYKLVLKTH